MANFDSHIGSFQLNTVAAGATVQVRGTGFEPKFIMFIGCDAGGSGTSGPKSGMAYGFYANGKQYSMCTNNFRSGAPPGTIRSVMRMSSTEAYHNLDNTNIVRMTFRVVALDPDGFDVFIDTDSAVANQGTRISYIALGGSALLVDLVQWGMPTVTGVHTVSGLDIQPSALMHFYLGTDLLDINVNDTILGIGMNNADVQLAHCSYDKNALPALNYRLQRDNSSILVIDNTGAASAQAEHNAFNSDGFAVNFTTAPASAFKVITVLLGATGNREWNAGFSIRPNGLVLASPIHENMPTNGVAANIFFMTGYCKPPSVSNPGHSARMFAAFTDDTITGEFTDPPEALDLVAENWHAIETSTGLGNSTFGRVHTDSIRYVGENLFDPPVSVGREISILPVTGTCDDPEWELIWGTDDPVASNSPDEFVYLWIGDVGQFTLLELADVNVVVMEILTVDLEVITPECTGPDIYEVPINCEAHLLDKVGTIVAHERVDDIVAIAKVGTLPRNQPYVCNL